MLIKETGNSNLHNEWDDRKLDHHQSPQDNPQPAFPTTRYPDHHPASCDLHGLLSRNKRNYVDNCDLVELIDYKEGRDCKDICLLRLFVQSCE
jgi:hypothetical protein